MNLTTIENEMINLKHRQQRRPTPHYYGSEHKWKPVRNSHIYKKERKCSEIADPTKKWLISREGEEITDHNNPQYSEKNVHRYSRAETHGSQSQLGSAYFTEYNDDNQSYQSKPSMSESQFSEHVSPLSLNQHLQQQSPQIPQTNYSFSGQTIENNQNIAHTVDTMKKEVSEPVIHCKIKIPEKGKKQGSFSTLIINHIKYLGSKSDLWIAVLIATGIFLILIQLFK